MPIRRRRDVILLVALVASIPATRAAAQDDGEGDRLTEAQSAFEAGEAAFGVRDYVGALSHFERAHELTGTPAILYNVGLVCDRLGRSERAIEAYEGYLRGEPDAPDRVEIEQRIDELRATPGGPPGTVPGGGDAAPRRAPEPEPASPRLFTWIAAGVTLAAAIATTALWIGAQNAYDDLESECGMSCDRARIDDSSGPGLQVAGNVVFALGLGALAATAALFFVEAPGGGEVAVAAGPGSVLVEGSF